MTGDVLTPVVGDGHYYKPYCGVMMLTCVIPATQVCNMDDDGVFVEYINRSVQLSLLPEDAKSHLVT